MTFFKSNYISAAVVSVGLFLSFNSQAAGTYVYDFNSINPGFIDAFVGRLTIQDLGTTTATQSTRWTLTGDLNNGPASTQGYQNSFISALRFGYSAVEGRTRQPLAFEVVGAPRFNQFAPAGEATRTAFTSFQELNGSSVQLLKGSNAFINFQNVNQANDQVNPPPDVGDKPKFRGTDSISWEYTRTQAADFSNFSVVVGGVTGGPYTAGTIITSPVPEPETYAMLLAGLGVILFSVRRKRNQGNGQQQSGMPSFSPSLA